MTNDDHTACAPLAAVEVDIRRCYHLRNLQLVDTFPREAASVDLLVGADQYYNTSRSKQMYERHPGTPIETKSRLGSLLSGPVSGSYKSKEMTAMLTVRKTHRPDDQLKRSGRIIKRDIKKMFLQIKLKGQDQNSHRLLWRDLHTH